MTELQEYDLDIKPVHIIKGHCPFQLVVEAVNMKEEEEYLAIWEQDIEMYNIEWASPAIEINYWYMDVHQYLEHGTISYHFSTWKKRTLRLKALSYDLVYGVLFRKNHNGVLLRCLEAHGS